MKFQFINTLVISFLSLASWSVLADQVIDINAEQLAKQSDANWLILDVRSAEEFSEGHVPNAINIPHTEIEQNIPLLSTHKDKPVVVYCRSGVRAAKATKILLEYGFSEIKHLQGDMQGWQQDGNTIEKSVNSIEKQ
ncbi:rhodanese-like domain-containing protein [Aliiglaciecola sp. LCG003]|uniref:rhodanese-like domain-containing protein n=1 Tax=Aliiglaciecola sp. LCG003 TaxID=3053655 RepID=UPI0025732D09|nr:rhodanese-like domain-containing protein [Aliiglaciecola sp. LCG003]WJG08889.1 rhodanese-like domain-containing protein [Aliiglaciecola sp. LCG003]